VAESITQHKNGSILFCPAPSKKEEDLGGGKDDDVKFKSTTKTLTLKQAKVMAGVCELYL
jgi:hypothetical protein